MTKTRSRALSARPDLQTIGQRVEVNVEGKARGTGHIWALHLDSSIDRATVRMDDGEMLTANLRWVWAI